MTSERHISDFGPREKPFDSLEFPPVPLGQSCPRQNPRSREELGEPAEPPNPLGDPLTIREVAALIGCSPWTVRHSYLPKGLPHLRSGPLGKLTFYRTQVVRWILERQKKGGM